MRTLPSQISSPTVVDSSLSPHKPTDESPLAQSRHQRARISPDIINQVSTPTSVTRRRTRSVYPNNTGVVPELSINENSFSRAQLREVSKVGVPNRVIHTVSYELKQESDDGAPFSESYSSEALSAKVDDNENEIPSAKRKRPSMRKQRYTEDDEEKQEEDGDETIHQTGPRKRPRENKKQDDHDEIAIGVEVCFECFFQFYQLISVR